MSEKKDPFVTLLQVAVGIACIPWYAFVAVTMWGWFAVPLGMHEIGKAHAYGLVAMVGLLRPYRKEEDTGIGVKIAYAALAPALTLLIGWICHSLM